MVYVMVYVFFFFFAVAIVLFLCFFSTIIGELEIIKNWQQTRALVTLRINICTVSHSVTFIMHVSRGSNKNSVIGLINSQQQQQQQSVSSDRHTDYDNYTVRHKKHTGTNIPDTTGHQMIV